MPLSSHFINPEKQGINQPRPGIAAFSSLSSLPKQRWVYKFSHCDGPDAIFHSGQPGMGICTGGKGRPLWEEILWARIWRKESTASLLCRPTQFTDEQAEVQRDQANRSRSQKHGVEKVRVKSVWLQSQSPCHHIKNVSVKWFPEKQTCWEDVHTYMQLETCGKVIFVIFVSSILLQGKCF